MAEEKEYEFDIDFSIGITGECMGKLKLTELKEKIKKSIEEHLEEEEAVAEYDIYQFEINKDYEEID